MKASAKTTKPSTPSSSSGAKVGSRPATASSSSVPKSATASNATKTPSRPSTATTTAKPAPAKAPTKTAVPKPTKTEVKPAAPAKASSTVKKETPTSSSRPSTASSVKGKEPEKPKTTTTTTTTTTRTSTTTATTSKVSTKVTSPRPSSSTTKTSTTSNATRKPTAAAPAKGRAPTKVSAVKPVKATPSSKTEKPKVTPTSKAPLKAPVAKKPGLLKPTNHVTTHVSSENDQSIDDESEKNESFEKQNDDNLNSQTNGLQILTSSPSQKSENTEKIGGGVKRVAGPAGRRAPTKNTVRTQNELQQARPADATNAGMSSNTSSYIGGFGLLASLGANKQSDQEQDFLSEFKTMKLNKVEEPGGGVSNTGPCLVQIKGRRRIIPRRVEATYKSLNKGDVFILISPTCIYEWRGSQSNRMEVAKGMDLAGRIKNKEMNGRANIVVLEEGKNDSTNSAFWELLGGKGKIADAGGDLTDEEEDKQELKDVVYLVVVSSGSSSTPKKAAPTPRSRGASSHTPRKISTGGWELLVISKKGERPQKSMLQSEKSYIIDSETELYVWTGRASKETERKGAMSLAKEMLMLGGNRQKWVNVQRIIEGTEPELFKEKFADWASSMITGGVAAVPKGNIAESKKIVEYDVKKLLAPAKIPIGKDFDDGSSGTIEIWKVKDKDKAPVPQYLYGHFFQTESYVIQYKYLIKNREVFLIYFWQGKKSTINEKGSSAVLTMYLDDEIGGQATQIRVPQNKEPAHFMAMFGGRIVIHEGVSEEYIEQGENRLSIYQARKCNVGSKLAPGGQIRLLEISQHNEASSENSEAVSLKRSPLNSNDWFIVNTVSTQFVWVGNASKLSQLMDTETVTFSEGAAANVVRGNRNQVWIREGKETEEFWNSLAGYEKDNYYTTPCIGTSRLFHCSMASGSFEIDEIVEFDQDDLDGGHLMILDTIGDEIFLWHGARAFIEEEKKLAMQAVIQYAKMMRADRGFNLSDNDNGSSELPLDSHVYLVAAGHEPYRFRAHFHGWDETKIVRMSRPFSVSPREGSSNGMVEVKEMIAQIYRTYTLSELTNNPPRALDPTKLESYLSDEEFSNVFKVTKDEFYALNAWKQEKLKKANGLY